MSLRIRLIIPVVLAVLVIGLGLAYDTIRDYRQHISQVLGDLKEQAMAVDAARHRVPAASFPKYVVDFCDELNSRLAPGHYVLVLDSRGDVLARAGRHGGHISDSLEQALLSDSATSNIIHFNGQSLAQARVREDDGSTVITARYLAYTTDTVISSLLRRALTTAVVAGIVSIVIIVVTNASVLRPVKDLMFAARAWAQRDFAAKIRATGPPEMRELADELNAMATELRSHDHMQQEELELARKIQRNLLPAAMPSLSGLRVVTNRRQAEHVSGDMYDAFELPNGTSAILLFNVTGHGIAAALLAGLVRMSLRYRSSETLDPGKALDAANKDITKAMSESEFVTACVGIWNAHDLTWSYAAAGSQCGVLLANGKSSRLECSGPSLGASYKGQWQTRVISLDAASRLFLYTDYLVKATATECCVDLPDLENLLATTGNLELEEQAATVLEVLRDLCIKSHSNMTLIGLEVLP